MLMVSVPIQMYDLTKSSAHGGGDGRLISAFVGMLIGGALADKYDRRIAVYRTHGRDAAFAGLT